MRPSKAADSARSEIDASENAGSMALVRIGLSLDLALPRMSVGVVDKEWRRVQSMSAIFLRIDIGVYGLPARSMTTFCQLYRTLSRADKSPLWVQGLTSAGPFQPWQSDPTPLGRSALSGAQIVAYVVDLSARQ